MDEQTYKSNLEFAAKAMKEQSEAEYVLENRLSIVANVILGLGIISAIIVFFCIALIEIHHHYEFDWFGFSIALDILIGAIITSGILKLLCEISKTLKQIKGNMK